MTSLLHQIPGSRSDLDSFARFWEWQRTVRQQLGQVLNNRALNTVFQPIFGLTSGKARACGYEALARFPTAPQIPAGLWFRIAREMASGTQLEVLAAQRAVDSYGPLPTDHFLTINASLSNARVIAETSAPQLETPLVIDVPYRSVHDKDCRSTFEAIRETGAQISLDDTPLDGLHDLKPAIQAVHPDYLKVDVLSGLFDNPMRRFNLSDAVLWCLNAGITLIAERVERPEDLHTLHDQGVEMAQGYSLARPVWKS